MAVKLPEGRCGIVFREFCNKVSVNDLQSGGFCRGSDNGQKTGVFRQKSMYFVGHRDVLRLQTQHAALANATRCVWIRPIGYRQKRLQKPRFSPCDNQKVVKKNRSEWLLLFHVLLHHVTQIFCTKLVKREKKNLLSFCIVAVSLYFCRRNDAYRPYHI